MFDSGKFITAYYSALTSRNGDLIHFYTPNSLLSYEGQTITGNDIVNKLESLPPVKYDIKNVEVQNSPDGLSTGVQVTGQMLIDDNEYPQSFAQTFWAVQENSPNPDFPKFVILNETFQFVYPEE